MGRPARWLLGRTERGWATSSTRVISVNDSYADVLASRWPIERPLVVMNCSYRFTPPRPARAALPRRARPAARREGRALSRRPVPVARDRAAGRCDPRRAERHARAHGLRRARADAAGLGGRSVDGRQGPGACRRSRRPSCTTGSPPADVAGMPIQGDTLNHRLTTPNKLFEAMAAGVPAVVSDLPGHERDRPRFRVGHPRRPDRRAGHRGRDPRDHDRCPTRTGTPGAIDAWRRRTTATTGRPRSSSCSTSTRPLTGKRW